MEGSNGKNEYQDDVVMVQPQYDVPSGLPLQHEVTNGLPPPYGLNQVDYSSHQGHNINNGYGVNSSSHGYSINNSNLAYSNQATALNTTNSQWLDYRDDANDVPMIATEIDDTTPPKRDYLGLSIFVTLCCCLPLGIIAIIYSTQSRSAKEVHNNRKAKERSLAARNLNIAGIVMGSIILIGYGVYMSLVMFKDN